MRDRLHEWPLVVFTALAIAGGGLLTAPLAAGVAGLAPSAAAPLLMRGALLVAAGMLVSLAHLGRPSRAPRAVAGLGGSWLSAEVLLGGAALATSALAALAAPSSGPAAMLAAALSVAFLVSLGLVYNLAGQYSWKGVAVVAPLNLGLAFGALSFATLMPAHAARTLTAVAVLLGLDTLLFAVRAERLARTPEWLRPAHPGLFAMKVPLLCARLALVDVLPVLLVVLGPYPAAAALGLGILLERIVFYALAAQHTTEGEVRRMEDEIA